MMMHDVDLFGIGESVYQKTVRTEGDVRISDGGETRKPDTPPFDDVKVGDELPGHRSRLSRGDLVNYAGRGRRRQPHSLGRGHRQAGRAARRDSARNADDGVGCRIGVRMVRVTPVR